MKKFLPLALLICVVAANTCAAQGLLDSCFASATPGTSFAGSANLTDATDADLIEWNGTSWIGGWSNANISTPPPCNAPPVRAVWMGDQTVWTSGGEGFGLRFSPPLVAGNTYAFFFTYTSEGFGSNGAFSPDVSTNNTGSTGGNLVGNLQPVGYGWETHPIIFTASAAQAGDDYIIIHSNDGSGMVLNMCAETLTDLGDDTLTICYGDSAILFAGNGYQSYSWSTGQTTNQITVTQAGTYMVTNTGFCSTSSDTIVVMVDPCGQFPVALFTTPDNHVCPGTCTSFTNMSQSATGYVWNFPGAVPSTSTDVDPASICYNTPGTYAVSLIASNGITSDTLTLNNFITVYPFSAPQGINQSGDTLFANLGSTSYQWFENGTMIPGATDYYYIATESGNYNVVCTDENGCEVEAAILNVIASVQSPVSVGSSSEQLEVFPNPVSDMLYVNRNTLLGTADIVSIYNLMGEKVLDISNAMKQSSTISIDIHSLSEGSYFLELQSGDKIFRSRFTKR